MPHSTCTNPKSSVLQGLFPSIRMSLVAALVGIAVPCALGQSVTFSAESFVGAGSSGVNSSGAPNQDYSASAGRVSANQRGDVFWINQPYNGNPNSLIEIPAGNIFGGSTAEVLLVSNLTTGSDTVTVDPLNNLWVQDGNDALLFLPFVNGSYASVNLSTTTPPTCALPVTSTVACLWPNINASQLGSYDQLSDIQVDASGNIYGVDFYDGSGESYGSKNRLVEYNGTTGVPTVLVDNLPFSGNGRLAVTSGGDIYYVDGTNVYHVPAGSSTATTISGFSSPTGVSIDSSGNLYITDEGNNRIAFVSNISGTLNFSNVSTIYIAASAQTLAHYPVGIDGYGDVFFEYPGYGGAFGKLSGANLRFGIDYNGVGSTVGPYTVNLIFNTATTFGSFTVTGGLGIVPFTTSNNTCTSGTAYAAGATCSVSVTYTANGAGSQSGMLEAFSTAGTLLGEARLSAFDDAPLMNIDPGTVTAIGTSWRAPSSIAVDAAGNTYVADSTTGSIYKNGSTTPIMSGLSSPSAVVVDAAGNLYVADTGNNRIRELTYSSGAYARAAVTLYTGLSGPSGLALDDNGNLYVADSGNSRVLLLASAGDQQIGTVATTVGSGFTTPVAVAVDNYGNNLYVADNGTKTVVQLALETSTKTTVLSGLTTASGIAVDASDSLYVVDSGAQTISRVGNNQGNFGSSTTLATVVGKPTSIALDTLGNVYATDTLDATVSKMSRTAGSLNFGSLSAGSTSSSLTATVTNGGAIYTGVSLSNPYYTASGSTADFTVQNTSSCGAGTYIYYGYGCTITAVFNPVSNASYTDTLTLSSNVAANTLTLTGTGIAATTLGSLTVTGFPTSTSAGTAGNVTVSAFDTTGAAMTSFTGTVTLTSSDPKATLPAAYTFTNTDAGVHTFSVTLNTGGTQSITATSGSVSASEAGIVVGDYIWLLNATGTTSKISESGSSVTNSGYTGTSSAHGGLAFDSSGNVWSVTSGSNSLVFSTKTGATPTTYSGGGLSSPVSLAIDGAGAIWIANSGNNSVSEFLNTGTAQSGTSGYGTTALSGPSAVIVDNAGSIWVTNKTGNSLTHIIGAATPVVTTLDKATSTGSLGVAP